MPGPRPAPNHKAFCAPVAVVWLRRLAMSKKSHRLSTNAGDGPGGCSAFSDRASHPRCLPFLQCNHHAVPIPARAAAFGVREGMTFCPCDVWGAPEPTLPQQVSSAKCLQAQEKWGRCLGCTIAQASPLYHLFFAAAFVRTKRVHLFWCPHERPPPPTLPYPSAAGRQQ